MRPPTAHRATTAALQSLYPFAGPRTGSSAGPLIGRDLMGGAFQFDPWEQYRAGRLTNPNILVLGQIGRGKSTFIKTLVWRQMAWGRQAWIIDPKGEYGALATACGTRPLALRPGGTLRLNPLECPATGDAQAHLRRRGELLASVLEATLGRGLLPAERAALDIAVRTASAGRAQPTIPDVVAALLDPEAASAAGLHTTADELARDGRPVALELRRMVQGDLAGMFDGPTSDGMDLGAGLVVIDLSVTFSSPALPVIMACATAWLGAALAAGAGTKRLVVIDEAWAILADLSTARWSQSAFKLSRQLGVANVVVVHRLSDLRSAGADGSSQQKLADGLLADSETRVVFGQPASEAALTADRLALSAVERDLLTALPRGMALWQVGGRSHLVEHLVGPDEWALVDTDHAMTEGPVKGPG